MAETIETMSPLPESHGNVAEMLGHCLPMASIEKAVKKLSELWATMLLRRSRYRNVASTGII